MRQIKASFSTLLLKNSIVDDFVISISCNNLSNSSFQIMKLLSSTDSTKLPVYCHGSRILLAKEGPIVVKYVLRASVISLLSCIKKIIFILE